MKNLLKLTIASLFLTGGLSFAALEYPPEGTPRIEMDSDPLIDFAKLEHERPLGDSRLLLDLTPEHLSPADPKRKWKQSHVEQLYARLTSGPIPDGIYLGRVIFPEGGNFEKFAGLLRTFGLNLDVTRMAEVAEAIWKGKHFRESRYLKNLLLQSPANATLLAKMFQYPFPGSPYAGLVGERLTAALAPVIRGIPLARVTDPETRLVSTFFEIFPANVFCGQSKTDSRRESVVIDYSHGDTIDGVQYIDFLDGIASRNGLRIRDEIRMIRPGFYLGVAYMDRTPLLNFSLYNKAVSDAYIKSAAGMQGLPPVPNQCRIGTQSRVRVVRK